MNAMTLEQPGNSVVAQKAKVSSGQKTEFSGKGMLSTRVDFTSTVLATELFVNLSSLFPANLFSLPILFHDDVMSYYLRSQFLCMKYRTVF